MFGIAPDDLLKMLLAFIAGLSPYFAAKMSRDGKKMESSVQLATLALTKEEKFQASILAQLSKVEGQAEKLGQEVRDQAIQIAELRGLVSSMKETETFLKAENVRLREENTQLTRRNEALDDENEAQAQVIAQITGRLAVYEPDVPLPSVKLKEGGL